MCIAFLLFLFLNAGTVVYNSADRGRSSTGCKIHNQKKEKQYQAKTKPLVILVEKFVTIYSS